MRMCIKGIPRDLSVYMKNSHKPEWVVTVKGLAQAPILNCARIVAYRIIKCNRVSLIGRKMLVRRGIGGRLTA